MTFSTLDTITRRYLLEKGLPIHWYLEILTHSSSAVRELSFDTLKIINTVRLPVNSYGAIDLPDDFVDDLTVAVPVGDSINPIPKQDRLNPIRIHDTTSGEFTPYVTTSTDGSQDFAAFPGIWNWYWNVNSYGEPTGRLFGSSGGTAQGYKLVKERRQIQLTDNFQNSNVVLLYISDGQRTDNATQVETMAQQAIQAWCDWKRSPNAAIKDSYEAATFYNERRLLRARLNDLTKTDILNIIRNSYTGAPKS